MHGLATLLVDGQVRVEAGGGDKDVQSLIRRVLVVQAEGFLGDGVRLMVQGVGKPPPRSTAKPRKARR